MSIHAMAYATINEFKVGINPLPAGPEDIRRDGWSSEKVFGFTRDSVKVRAQGHETQYELVDPVPTPEFLFDKGWPTGKPRFVVVKEPGRKGWVARGADSKYYPPSYHLALVIGDGMALSVAEVEPGRKIKAGVQALVTVAYDPARYFAEANRMRDERKAEKAAHEKASQERRAVEDAATERADKVEARFKALGFRVQANLLSTGWIAVEPEIAERIAARLEGTAS